MTCCARRVGFDTLHSQPVEGHRSPTMAYTVRRHRLSSITRAPGSGSGSLGSGRIRPSIAVANKRAGHLSTGYSVPHSPTISTCREVPMANL